ncbi:metal-sensing transcriptional repressor [Chloroflexota bacterium]
MDRTSEIIIPTQLAAVRSAIDSVAGLILKNYMKICFRGETAAECVDVESLARIIAIWGRVHVGD